MKTLGETSIMSNSYGLFFGEAFDCVSSVWSFLFLIPATTANEL